MSTSVVDVKYDLDEKYRYFITRIFVNGQQEKEILFQSLFPQNDTDFQSCINHAQQFIRASLIDMGLAQY